MCIRDSKYAYKGLDYSYYSGCYEDPITHHLLNVNIVYDYGQNKPYDFMTLSSSTSPQEVHILAKNNASDLTSGTDYLHYWYKDQPPSGDIKLIEFIKKLTPGYCTHYESPTIVYPTPAPTPATTPEHNPRNKPTKKSRPK